MPAFTKTGRVADSPCGDLSHIIEGSENSVSERMRRHECREPKVHKLRVDGTQYTVHASSAVIRGGRVVAESRTSDIGPFIPKSPRSGCGPLSPIEYNQANNYGYSKSTLHPYGPQTIHNGQGQYGSALPGYGLQAQSNVEYTPWPHQGYLQPARHWHAQQIAANGRDVESFGLISSGYGPETPSFVGYGYVHAKDLDQLSLDGRQAAHVIESGQYPGQKWYRIPGSGPEASRNIESGPSPSQDWLALSVLDAAARSSASAGDDDDKSLTVDLKTPQQASFPRYYHAQEYSGPAFGNPVPTIPTAANNTNLNTNLNTAPFSPPELTLGRLPSGIVMREDSMTGKLAPEPSSSAAVHATTQSSANGTSAPYQAQFQTCEAHMLAKLRAFESDSDADDMFNLPGKTNVTEVNSATDFATAAKTPVDHQEGPKGKVVIPPGSSVEAAPVGDNLFDLRDPRTLKSDGSAIFDLPAKTSSAVAKTPTHKQRSESKPVMLSDRKRNELLAAADTLANLARAEKPSTAANSEAIKIPSKSDGPRKAKLAFSDLVNASKSGTLPKARHTTTGPSPKWRSSAVQEAEVAKPAVESSKTISPPVKPIKPIRAALINNSEFVAASIDSLMTSYASASAAAKTSAREDSPKKKAVILPGKLPGRGNALVFPGVVSDLAWVPEPSKLPKAGVEDGWVDVDLGIGGSESGGLGGEEVGEEEWTLV